MIDIKVKFRFHLFLIKKGCFHAVLLQNIIAYLYCKIDQKLTNHETRTSEYRRSSSFFMLKNININMILS